MPLACVRAVLLGMHADVAHDLFIFRHIHGIVKECALRVCVRFAIQRKLVAIQYIALSLYADFKLIFVEICIQMTVEYFERVAVKRDIHLLILIFYFKQSGIRRAIGSYDTVESKTSRVWLIPKISAVAPLVFAVFFYAYTLVGKVPNISACKSVILAEHIPIIAEIAKTVAHTVRVLALNKRQVAIHIGSILTSHRRPYSQAVSHRLVFTYDRHLFYLGVHLAEHVSHFALLIWLIVYKTRLVQRKHSLFHCIKIFAKARFIAKRPAYYTRMVAQSAHHICRSVYALFLPLLA